MSRLEPISQCELTDSEKIQAAFLRDWDALDTESGAFLSQTNGRTRDGLPKFILILPNQTPSERGGLLERYDWDYPGGRKFIRAWSLKEAIEIANQKLEKMLKEQKRGQNHTNLATV